jgi:hypothetical protein
MPARIRADGFVDPCIPTLAAKPPAGPDWVHASPSRVNDLARSLAAAAAMAGYRSVQSWPRREIKHDGYRLIVRRDGDAVHLFTIPSRRLQPSSSGFVARGARNWRRYPGFSALPPAAKSAASNL